MNSSFFSLIKALIFDLDGTILDNNHVYSEAFRTVLRLIGGRTLNEPLPLKGSIGVGPNWPGILQKYHLSGFDIQKLTQQTQEEYLRNIGKTTLRRGFWEFVKSTEEKNVKMALATSNEKKVTEAVLSRFELNKIFAVKVCLEDVDNLKPAPDLFLKAAERLEVYPIDCLVIEDAEAGIVAAHQAGMRVACLTDDQKNVLASQADLVFVDYFDLAEKIGEI